MDNFTNHRLKHADNQYLAHPLTLMDDAQLTELAVHTQIEEIRQMVKNLTFILTCPLCGQPQPRLTSCGICAWTEGADIISGLCEQMKAALSDEKTNAGLNNAIADEFQPVIFTADQINHAARNAYMPGGCMICEVCQRHTQTLADTCPLRMLANRTIHPCVPLPPLVYEVIRLIPDHEQQIIQSKFLRLIWENWCNYWNTTAQHTVLHWRTLLLFGAWKPEDDHAS